MRSNRYRDNNPMSAAFCEYLVRTRNRNSSSRLSPRFKIVPSPEQRFSNTLREIVTTSRHKVSFRVKFESDRGKPGRFRG